MFLHKTFLLAKNVELIVKNKNVFLLLMIYSKKINIKYLFIIPWKFANSLFKILLFSKIIVEILVLDNLFEYDLFVFEVVQLHFYVVLHHDVFFQYLNYKLIIHKTNQLK